MSRGRRIETCRLGLSIQPGNRPCTCDVAIIPTSPKPVVVMIQLADDDGVSVTNACEHIASVVATRFLRQAPGAIDLDAATWVEHYPVSARGRELGESYDIVTFTHGGGSDFRPAWRHLGTAGFRELAGMTLDEVGIR